MSFFQKKKPLLQSNAASVQMTEVSCRRICACSLAYPRHAPVSSAGDLPSYSSHVQAEAALAQSDFNIEKITEIQNKFTGGVVSHPIDSILSMVTPPLPSPLHPPPSHPLLRHRPCLCLAESSSERACCGRCVGKGRRNGSSSFSMTSW